MKKHTPILFLLLTLTISSLACALTGGGTLSISGLRLAHDEDGVNVTTSFTPSDEFFAIADLAYAPAGTLVVAHWVAMDVTDVEPGLIQEQTYSVSADSFEEGEETFSGIVFFHLTNGTDWPTGTYKLELYLNGTLAQVVEFEVR